MKKQTASELSREMVLKVVKIKARSSTAREGSLDRAALDFLGEAGFAGLSSKTNEAYVSAVGPSTYPLLVVDLDTSDTTFPHPFYLIRFHRDGTKDEVCCIKATAVRAAPDGKIEIDAEGQGRTPKELIISCERTPLPSPDDPVEEESRPVRVSRSRRSPNPLLLQGRSAAPATCSFE